MNALDVKSAIETGDVIALRQLLLADSTLANTRIRWGTNGEVLSDPLHYVSDMVFNGTLQKAKAVPVVETLIASGADVNFQLAGRGETPLIGAASLGAEDIGLRLLAAGAKPDLLGNASETALHWAAVIGADRLVAALIERGASVNVQDDNYKARPLEWALHGWTDPPPGSVGNHYNVVASLVAAGAQVDPPMLTSPKVLGDPVMLSALQTGKH